MCVRCDPPEMWAEQSAIDAYKKLVPWDPGPTGPDPRGDNYAFWRDHAIRKMKELSK